MWRVNVGLKNYAMPWLSCLLACYLMCCASMSVAQMQPPSISPQQLQEVLKPLEIFKAVGLANSTLESVVAYTPGYEQLSEMQRLSLQRRLKTVAGSEALEDQLIDALSELDSQLFSIVDEQLQSPLIQRANNFDIALEMPGAYEKFGRYREGAVKDEPAVRRELVMRLVSLKGQARIAALLQSELALMSELLTAELLDKKPSPIAEAVNRQQRKARESYLQSVATDLHLYSYVYMKTDELERLVAIFETPEVERVVQASVKALEQILTNARAELRI